jgi:predicted metal-dependent HD superfamily phosphohydrolase
MNLLERAEAFTREHVRRVHDATLRFHDEAHFAQVAAFAAQLAKASGLPEADAQALGIAGWMHDLGYCQGPEGHEERSADQASAFLRGEGAPEEFVKEVRRLILATRTAVPPADELEGLMKDADMGHVGAADYPQRLALLREERELRTGVKMKRKEWVAQNVSFLEQFTFHTAAARTLWGEGLARNIEALKHMKDPEGHPKADDAASAEKAEKKAAKKALKAKREKLKETERGVETMFRVTLNNHTRLSQIADNKANIMLTVNALMISLMLGGPMTKVGKHPEYLMPLGLVLLTSAICIVTATLATRPSVTHGRTTREEIKRKEANLLFFGNFHNMPLQEYQADMRELMEDRDYLYGTMTKDLHALGKVLHRKYKFLRITYTIFMIGVTSAVVMVLWMASRGTEGLFM